MMKRLTLLCILLMAGFFVQAQNEPEPPKETKEKTKTKPSRSNAATPKNMWEIGLNPGVSFSGADIDTKPAYGVGLHFRKAIDYVFSLRGDFLWTQIKGENPAGKIIRDFDSDWMSGSIFGVFSLNSLRWDKPVRRTNIYMMAGGGLNFFETAYNNEFVRKGTIQREMAGHAAIGAGFSFRLGKRINLALEQQAFGLFGNRADLIDGLNDRQIGTRIERSVFRDIVAFSSLAINFNIGNAATQSEPLYWINPLDNVLNDINQLKSRPEVSLEDSDQDGVIDAIDQELNTPAGAIVDTKGRTLDSDRDGVPDYQDREPFYTPQEGEKVNEEGVVINPGPRGGVTEERVKELIDQALQNYQLTDNRTTAAEWFLPMIHFATDAYVIKYSDYGNLASVARTLRSNPNLRLVVTGFADATGTENYNKQLSYNRAKAVIDHLVTNHGVGRGRLVLQWKGSQEGLVPTNSSYMNRRVEFRVAGPGDYEMDPPSGKDGY